MHRPWQSRCSYSGWSCAASIRCLAEGLNADHEGRLVEEAVLERFAVQEIEYRSASVGCGMSRWSFVLVLRSAMRWSALGSAI